MDVALVLALAAGAGLAVYRLAMRSESDATGGGFLPRESEEPAGPVPEDHETPVEASTGGGIPVIQPGMPSVPFVSARRSGRTRVAGLIGILLLVPLVAAVFAAALYQLGHIVNQMLARFVSGA